MDAKFFDSLFEGDSPNGVRLGMGLTGGDFWPRIAGCQVLYRGHSIDEIDFSKILALTEIDASEISPPTYITHDSYSTYFYIVRRVNRCGYEEQTLVGLVKVSIDAEGNLARPRPNDVFGAIVVQMECDKIELVWYYCPVVQQTAPVCFRVYYDAGTSQIDYENAIAIVSYEGPRFYSYRSDALDAGTYIFAVRAEDAAGEENASLTQIRIQLDTTSPDVINILSAESI